MIGGLTVCFPSALSHLKSAVKSNLPPDTGILSTLFGYTSLLTLYGSPQDICP